MIKKSNHQTLFNSLISLFIIIGIVLFTQTSMSNPNQVCFLPEPGDTNSFASSVAVNDKYLVVGDPGANRVVVYQKDSQDRWYREREIYPPENSISYERRNGFGINLILGENALLVDNWSTTLATSKTNLSIPGSIFRGQYLIQLNREQDTIPIELSVDEEEEFVKIYILSEDRPKLISLPDTNEDLFGHHIKRFSNFAVSKNLLLVGSPSRHVNSPNGGKGWLFNLDNLNGEATELSSKNAFIGDTVAMSEQFAVVGNKRTRRIIGNNVSYPKTLIRSLNNNSTVVTDDYGNVSLDKNVLAIMLPSSRRHMRARSVLKIFNIDDYATPHLIQERTYNRRAEQYLIGAELQNGWLITIYRFGRVGHTKFCIEPVKQITEN